MCGPERVLDVEAVVLDGRTKRRFASYVLQYDLHANVATAIGRLDALRGAGIVAHELLDALRGRQGWCWCWRGRLRCRCRLRRCLRRLADNRSSRCRARFLCGLGDASDGG